MIVIANAPFNDAAFCVEMGITFKPCKVFKLIMPEVLKLEGNKTCCIGPCCKSVNAPEVGNTTV